MPAAHPAKHLAQQPQMMPSRRWRLSSSCDKAFEQPRLFDLQQHLHRLSQMQRSGEHNGQLATYPPPGCHLHAWLHVRRANSASLHMT
eukprot:CAMPEP_0181445168 /NCGR_PEP_ID=MMETSP1110-20121109/25448_1 /TAXON_ID=174948 /ORGANISM="Symbiodinium sp., Strain CCMP421" /LENGTH=87 /DNA_ID=CAMNT_0023569203 /DNA_START=552 /DNA_END=815 /DNA_ORIENTATION=-